MSFAKKLAARFDGWMNLFTGLGTARDKSQAWDFARESFLDPERLDALFHFNDLARRVVSALPDEAMRHGFDLENTDDDADAEQVQEECAAVQATLDQLGAEKRMHEGMVWGRLFGGSGVLIGAEGAGDPSLPMRDENVRRILFLSVLDRRELWPRSFYGDPMKPKFGEVETYYYRPLGAAMAGGLPLTPVPAPVNVGERIIHESRIIMFRGSLTSRWNRRVNLGWDASVLDPVYQTLMQTAGNWAGVCHLMTDLAQGVFKIKGLMDLIAAGQEDTMRKRMEIVDMGRSVARSVILDAEGEDFERKGTPLTGVPDLVNATWQRLAAAAEMPVTVLMGMSPAGLNATGDSDIRNWYDRVRSYQQLTVKPKLDRLVKLAAQVSGVDNPAAWEVSFPSLWQMSPKERADLGYQVAQADKLYVDMGAVLPEEVALARSSDDAEYSVDFPPIDMDVRKTALQSELEKLEENAGKPDPVPPAPGQPGAPGAPQSSETEMQGGEAKTAQ